MMILRNYNWEHEIKFYDGSVTHLFIENPITFREYVLSLLSQYNGESGNFILSENNKEISIQKNLAIITDPINLKFDEKKINTKINKDLLQIIQYPELQKNYYPLISLVEKYANQITDEYQFNISYETPEESSILKMLNFHINTEYTSLADKLQEWININHDILGISNFVIVNTSCFFSYDEIQTFTSECSSQKHNILFIDQFNYHQIPNSITIDSDNCELYNSPLL